MVKVQPYLLCNTTMLLNASCSVGEGLTGNSYAIPTKDFNIRTRSLKAIQDSVNTFIQYAKEHPEMMLSVTKIGCGLAGYSEYQSSPMFKNAPSSCKLPDYWRKV